MRLFAFFNLFILHNQVVAATECTPGWVDLTVTPGPLSKEIARATILEHLEPLKYHFEHLEGNPDLQYKLNDNGYLEHVAMNKATLGRTISQYWFLSPDDFERAHRCNSDLCNEVKNAIKKEFGIDWSQVEYADLDRPNLSLYAYILYLESFDDITFPLSGSESFQKTICNKTNCDPDEFLKHLEETKLDVMETCRAQKNDVTIVLDTSGSVGSDGFDKAKKFLIQMLDYFWEDSTSTTKISILFFNSRIQWILKTDGSFSTAAEKASLINAINGYSYVGGQTYTGEALQEALNKITKFGRSDAIRTLVLFTDGYANGRNPTFESALSLISSSSLALRKVSIGFENGDGDTKIDINRMEDFSSPVLIIDQSTFSEGAGYIMSNICGATVKIQGDSTFTHCFESNETKIFLEVDFTTEGDNTNRKEMHLKSPSQLAIIYSDKFPKPNSNVQGGHALEYNQLNQWQDWQNDKYDKLYLTVVNPLGKPTCFDMVLVPRRRRRRREGRFESSSIPESVGCNMFETCVQGECQCSGTTDSVYADLCVYSQLYPQLYDVYLMNRINKILGYSIPAFGAGFRSSNEFDLTATKKKYQRQISKAIEFAKQNVQHDKKKCPRRENKTLRRPFNTKFHDFGGANINETNVDFCEINRNILDGLRTYSHSHGCGTKQENRFIDKAEDTFLLLAGELCHD